VNSREKLEDGLRSMITEEPGEDAHPVELAMRGMLQLAGGHIAMALLDYEDELDEMILKAAGWLLARRSDDAPAASLIVACEKPELTAGT
jgi:hypothetical protein